MATQLQLRRGTTTEHSTFVGAVGEVTVDTTKDTLVVHDGATTAGFPLAKESTVTALDSAAVHKTGDETIAGTKTLSSNPVLSSGTVNGVAYLNGSKVLTTGSALTFDGAFLTSKSLVVADGANGYAQFGSSNTYSIVGGVDNGGFRYNVDSGQTHQFRIAASEQMRLTSTGLGIGTSSPSEKLSVNGNIGLPKSGVTRIYNTQSTSDSVKLGGALNIEFETYSGSSWSTKMLLDNSGNLGLGVTPSAWYSNRKALQVGAGASIVGATNYYTELRSNSYLNASASEIYLSNGYATMYQTGGGSHYWYTAPSGTAGNAISFTQAMTLDASGNLALGTTASPSTFGARIISNGNLAAISNSRFDLFNGDNTQSWGLQAPGSGGSAALTFTQLGVAERMRIDSSGNLLVGTTSQQSSGKFCVTFDGVSYNGNVLNDTSSGASIAYSYFLRSGTLKGSITYSSGSNTVAYNTTSDYRLKTDIVDLPNALETVSQLKPRQYKWKSNGHIMTGFIAHELQAVVPDCVTGEKDAVDEEGNPVYQGIDTSFLVATLTKAIQELKAEVDSLKSQLENK